MVGSSHVNMGPSLSLVLTDYPLSSALAIRLRRCTPLPHICSTCLPSPAPQYATTCKLLCHRNNVVCCLVSQQHQLNDKKTTNTKIAGSLNTCLDKFVSGTLGECPILGIVPSCVCLFHFRWCRSSWQEMASHWEVSLSLRIQQESWAPGVLGQISKHRSKHDQVLFF